MWERTIPKFESKNPGIKIDFYGAPWAEAMDKLIVELQSSSPPDVFNIPWTPYTPLIPFMEPLDEYIERYNWPVDEIALQKEFPGTWPKEMGGDGKTYQANMMNAEESALIYRKDIFKEKGIPDPEEEGYPHWSLDEFLDVVRKCTYTKSDGTKVFGYAFPTNPADGMSRWTEDWIDYLYSAGGGLVRPERPGEIICGKDPYLKANVEVGEFMRTLVREELVPVGTVKPKYFEMQILGRVAMARHGPWQFGTFKETHPEQLPNVGATLLPFFGKGWNYTDQTGAGGHGMAKAGKHKEEAFKFIDFTMSKECLLSFAEELFWLPCNMTILTDEYFDKYPFMKAFVEAAKISKTHLIGFTLKGFEAQSNEMWKAHFDTQQKIINTDEDIEGLYIQLQERLETIAKE
ncbi:hypothetical protein DRO58_04720 [Candidatus Bathyarchaeota archaeon]|nr:MAG: hypothetical protein DRO58_04720 [Candidatus Bathyarchaeota archaeon]